MIIFKIYLTLDITFLHGPISPSLGRCSSVPNHPVAAARGKSLQARATHSQQNFLRRCEADHTQTHRGVPVREGRDPERRRSTEESEAERHLVKR